MRPIDLSLLTPSASRLICTLAPPSSRPPSNNLFVAPPVLVARNRTKVDGSFLLLSSLHPDGARKAWLGPARQLTRYSVVQTKSKTQFSLEITNAMRRFSKPELRTNVAQLGALGNPYISRKHHLQEMLLACLRTEEGMRGLFEADVVAERDVIKQLMLPHKASFNASFAQGVLFLDGVEESIVDWNAFKRDLGFRRACTEMYNKGYHEPRGRARHTLHSVVARPLGGLNLLMSGSVDCIEFQYNKDPACYMQLVTRPIRGGTVNTSHAPHGIRPKVWKEWYIRAHLMGIRSLYLGLIDEAGVLQDTSPLAMDSLPEAAAARGAPWDPEDNFHWAFRALIALRDYCQEATDLYSISRRKSTARPVWRIEISPVGSETRLLVRELAADERSALGPGKRDGLVPHSVIKAYEAGYP
ncbi:hypothetical protein C8R44DRAFT_384697 [Mycena epipterygia]|nr:hypothetical protein C8R44DRAFT_384697 [Mycena epipterygia]